MILPMGTGWLSSPGPETAGAPAPGVLAVGGVFLGLLAAGIMADIILLAAWGRRPRGHRFPVRVRLDAWPAHVTRRAGIAILLWTAAAVVALQAWHAGFGMSDRTVLLAQGLLLHAGGLVVLLAALRGRPILRPVRSWTASVRKGILYYLAMLPPLWLATMLYHAVLRALGLQPELQDFVGIMMDDHGLWMWIYFVLLAVVFAAVFEELLFRGLGLALLAPRFGWVAAVAVTAAGFAALHMHLSAFVPLMVCGTAFALAYIRSGTLLTPIVMHALFNGANLAMLLMMRAASGTASGIDIPGPGG